MTPADVQKMVDDLAVCCGDDEAAHETEDRIHQDVLKAIATGKAKNPRECARIALTTRDLDFSRWYA